MELFQSTLPIQGATENTMTIDYDQQISIHAPNTGSDCFERLSTAIVKISIHAPNTGSDKAKLVVLKQNKIFQSTLPIQGATHNFPLKIA